MAQPQPSNYYSSTGTREERSQAIVEQASDTARDMSERAGSIAQELASSVRERPYTTLAIAAGLAFAVGAIWKLGQRRQPTSRMERLLAQLPELPDRNSLARWWRHAAQ
jgi:hypothetical protein